MRIHYLEIVTPNVDAACALYGRLHGVTFGQADPVLAQRGAHATAAVVADDHHVLDLQHVDGELHH